MQTFYSLFNRFVVILLFLGVFRLPILTQAQELSQEYALKENQLELLLRTTQTEPSGLFLDAPHVTVFDRERVDLEFSFSRNKLESLVNDIKMGLLPTISADKSYVLLDTHYQMTCPAQQLHSFQAQFLIPDEKHIILAFFKKPTLTDDKSTLLQKSRMNRLNNELVRNDTNLGKLFTIIICKPKIILPQPNATSGAYNRPFTNPFMNTDRKLR